VTTHLVIFVTPTVVAKDRQRDEDLKGQMLEKLGGAE
jgi:hypothetical protein